MIKAGQIVTVGGIKVRILSIDSDASCAIWGVSLDDADASVWFYRNEIDA